MIDGIKILNLKVNINELLKNELLLFPLPIDENGGEILINKPRTAVYKGLIITLKNGNIKFKGSLHVYFNNGHHNYNDFHFRDIITVVNELPSLFKIDIKQSVLNNLEFGVNILTSYKINDIFNNIINYKGMPFQRFNFSDSNGIECITNNFIIKIYEKCKQKKYHITENILRGEIKVIKMVFFENNGIEINTLQSLLNYTEIYKLKQVLTSMFDDILFTDLTIEQDKLNQKELLILSNGNNPNYWKNIKPNSKSYYNGNKDKMYISQRKKYYRELANYKAILNKYSTSTMKKDLLILISNKAEKLLKYEVQKVDKFTDFINCESGQIHISNIVRICPQTDINPKRLCLTCNKDISHKKRTAKYCSKKCKNDYTNPRLNPKNNLLNRINRINKQSNLFDITEFLQLNEYQLNMLNQKNTIQRGY